jgi:predicted acetyltransferase
VTETYAPAREEDLPALASILSWSFHFPPADTEPWIRRAGIDQVRVLARSAGVASCLVRIPMGQFFGGRPVPMVGVAGVAVAPEARGTGAATAIMRQLVEELARGGIALSTLYPATRSLYRKLGYEVAGSHDEVAVPLSMLDAGDRALPVHPMARADEPAVIPLYSAYARAVPGHLDRGPYVWERVFRPRGESPRGFLAGDKNEPEGYAVFYEKRPSITPGQDHDLYLTDFVARTPRAHARLVTLLRDHGTLGGSLVYAGGPGNPLTQSWLDRRYVPRKLDHWMLRIVDVPRALAARGYPPVHVDLELEVEDVLLPANAGRWHVHVTDKGAVIERGGNGKLRLDVRALASLYSGHMSAHALRALGALDGDNGVIDDAEAVFASRAPWMPDFF